MMTSMEMESGHEMDMASKETESANTQPFAWPPSAAKWEWESEKLAAEALATDMSKWIVFDPSESDPSELDKFLELNSPSSVQRTDGFGWISVLGPRYLEERPWEVEDEDREGVKLAWEAMQKSGRPITFQTVLDLARAHKCLSGKWLFHVETGFKVDHAWAKIARAVVSGQCGMTAKVCGHDNNKGDRQCHVICVYNSDFNDQKSILALEEGIRSVGIKCSMTYKPDAFTYLGIYRKNKWQLRPSIYSSHYDLNLGRSKVTANYVLS